MFGEPKLEEFAVYFERVVEDFLGRQLDAGTRLSVQQRVLRKLRLAAHADVVSGDPTHG